MNQNRTTLVVGVILILAGGLFLLAQFTGLVNVDALWPFIIMGIGALFFIGMVIGGKPTSALAIPGSIITMVGLILLVQDITGWWETWSYAWALIVVSVGIGIAIAGYWGDDPRMRKSGFDLARVGLILFLVFGAIMQIIFAFTGVSKIGGLLFWAILLTLVGLYLLVSRVYRLIFKPEQARTDDRDLFGPFFLIGIGIVAGLYSLGWIDNDDIFRMISLWPLLLIVAGLQLIIGRRSAWLSGLLGILLVAGMLVAVISGEQLGIEPFPLTISGSTITFGGGERITGSGVLFEESIPIIGVNEVNLESIGKLTIIQGEPEGLVIEAEDNLMDYIITEVNGNKLTLGIKSGYSLAPQKGITYTLTVKELVRLDVSGAASASIPSLTTDDFTLVVSGASHCTIDALQADSIQLDASGSSQVKVSGIVGDLRVDASGAANFDGSDMQSVSAIVDASGAANVTVWATDDLTADVSGASRVAYYGNPDLLESTSGAGSVSKKGNK